MSRLMMSYAPLSYEQVAMNPGRFRVSETPDLLQIELVPRPAWGRLPAVVTVWSVAAAFCVVLWWLDHSLDLTGHSSGKAVVVIVSAPFSALFVSALLVRPDLQRLSIVVDRTGVTIVRTMLGQPDRQRIALADLSYVGPDPAEPNVIVFATKGGGARVPIARKPIVVAEISKRICERVVPNGV